MGFKGTRSQSVGKQINSWRNRDAFGRQEVDNTRLDSVWEQNKFTPLSFEATGGDQSPEAGLAPGNGYKYHVFDSPGTLAVTSGTDSSGKTCEVLVLGGGGGGGEGWYCGGGGGGGLALHPALPVASGDHTIVVGEGGAANTGDGEHSVFGAPATGPFPTVCLIAIGGGHGGPRDASSEIGGCGGGTGLPHTTHPVPGPVSPFPSVLGVQTSTTYAPYANNPTAGGGQLAVPAISVSYGHGCPGAIPAYGSGGGGTGPMDPTYPVGDPGGIGGRANPGPTGPPAFSGGHGLRCPGFEYPLVGLSPLDPLSPTNNQYGGGGGGAGFSAPKPFLGGYGGGGKGDQGPGAQTAGTNKLGGGGGGAYGDGVAGKAGGDGIVIIRYLA